MLTFFSIAPNELTSTTNDSLDNTAYKLCAKLPSPRPNEVILGYDIVLYKRAPLKEEEEENITYTVEVFLIEQVNATEKWDQLLGHAIIQSDATGWQVFHIDSRHNDNDQQLCVNMYSRVGKNSTVQLLNTTIMKQMFVLSPSSLEDQNKSPQLIQYTKKITVTPVHYQPPPFPFFTKRSSPQHNTKVLRETQYEGCSVQNYTVSLSEHFGLPIISPVTANLGTCARMQHANTEDKDTLKESVLTLKADEFEGQKSSEDHIHIETQWQCAAAEFEDLHVLVLVDDAVALTVLSDAVITKCATLSPDSVNQ